MDVWGVEERYVVLAYLMRMNVDVMWLDIVRLAAFLEESGVKKNDTVAVFTTNSPEMYVIILALSKLSAVAGLVNINLRGTSPFAEPNITDLPR